MADEPMTLIERLLNPAWERPSLASAHVALLNVVRTTNDMKEAAEELQRIKLKKRPVAFRVKASNGDWILYEDEEAASAFADANNIEYQGLYVRDGT